jgi:hypothetical protein
LIIRAVPLIARGAWSAKWARVTTVLGTRWKARSDAEPMLWRGSAERGRAAQAFKLCKPDMADGPPPIHSPRAAASHDRMTRSPSRSSLGELLADSGSEPGARTSPLFEEPAARVAWHDRQAISRVGWTSPPNHVQHGSLRYERPLRTLPRRTWSRTIANRNLCLSSDSCLLE